MNGPGGDIGIPGVVQWKDLQLAQNAIGLWRVEENGLSQCGRLRTFHAVAWFGRRRPQKREQDQRYQDKEDASDESSRTHECALCCQTVKPRSVP